MWSGLICVSVESGGWFYGEIGERKNDEIKEDDWRSVKECRNGWKIMRSIKLKIRRWFCKKVIVGKKKEKRRSWNCGDGGRRKKNWWRIKSGWWESGWKLN